jgi:hypothetical protein
LAVTGVDWLKLFSGLASRSCLLGGTGVLIKRVDSDPVLALSIVLEGVYGAV